MGPRTPFLFLWPKQIGRTAAKIIRFDIIHAIKCIKKTNQLLVVIYCFWFSIYIKFSLKTHKSNIKSHKILKPRTPSLLHSFQYKFWIPYWIVYAWLYYDWINRSSHLMLLITRIFNISKTFWGLFTQKWTFELVCNADNTVTLLPTDDKNVITLIQTLLPAFPKCEDFLLSNSIKYTFQCSKLSL